MKSWPLEPNLLRHWHATCDFVVMTVSHGTGDESYSRPAGACMRARKEDR